MLNLQEAILDFATSDFRYSDTDRALDDRMLQALDRKHSDRSERIETVVGWLHSYSVLRTITPSTSRLLANNLLDYADTLHPGLRLFGPTQIKEEFLRLEGFLRQGASLFGKSDAPRRIDSLTSKALWCCYPHDVPMLDGNAELSLKVIARFCNVTVVSGQTRYASFVDAWFQVYRDVEPFIDLENYNGLRYKVRVLDSFLWWAGQQSFAPAKAIVCA